MKKPALLILVLLVSAAGIDFLHASDDNAGINLYYGENAQVEIVSPKGIHVYVDVHDPSVLSTPGASKDLLLTTHHHPDHINMDMIDEFKGRQLDAKTGVIISDDVKVTGIASGHNSADALIDEGGTNYIFIIEVAGMRIAHFGDIGQDSLTDAQIQTLGKIDIAVSQFDNAYSSMDVRNKKGFKLIAQLNPKLIIPTHISDDAVDLLGKTYQSFYSRKAPLKILRSALPDKTSVIFMGIPALVNGRRVKAKEFK